MYYGKSGKTTSLKATKRSLKTLFIETLFMLLLASLQGPVMAVDCRGSYTNTTMLDAYRGAGRPEAAREHLRIRSAAGLTNPEPCVIRTPPAGLLYQAHDAILAVGEVRAEPLCNYVEQLMWQAQENIACLVGAGAGDSCQYRLDLMVVDGWYDRCDEHAGWDAVFGQPGYRI